MKFLFLESGKLVTVKLNKYWLISFLGLLLILIAAIKLFGKSASKQVIETSLLNKIINYVPKTNLDLTTTQEGIKVLFDQQLENIKQPFIIPNTIQLPVGNYTLQAFKDGFETKTMNIKLESGKHQSVTIELSPLSTIINPRFYRLITEKDITAIGWNQKQLLYQARNKIKEVEKNTTLVTLLPNSQTQFSGTDTVLVNTQNNLSLITNLLKIKPLGLNSSLARLSSSKTKIALLKNPLEIEVINLDNKQPLTTISFKEGEINNFNWSPKENSLAVVNIANQQYMVFLTTLENNHSEQILAETNPVVDIAFSPEEKYLLITSHKNISIYNIDKKSTLVIQQETDLIDNLAVWRKENELILIEKVNQNNKVFDKITKVNPLTGEKEFLAISAPIINRINLETKPVLSPNSNALALKENNGSLWLLILGETITDFFPKTKLPQEDNSYSAP